MPRRPRCCPAGTIFHVLNRAVARLPLFEKPADYDAFERVLAEAGRRQWLDHVNEPQTESELAAIRHSIRRGTPYGSESWTSQSAARLRLAHTLRPRGRPRKPRN